MFLPYSHEDLSTKRLPWITIGIIALNLAVFIASLFIVSGEQAAVKEKAQKVVEYYLDHPYLKLSDFILEKLPVPVRKLLDNMQQTAAQNKEERDRRLAAQKERTAAGYESLQKNKEKQLFDLKEKRLSARNDRQRDLYEREIERLEKDLEKIKQRSEGESDVKTAASVQEEQAELDRLTLEMQKAVKETFNYQYGLVPNNFHWWAILTSMFMHGGWFHLIGNMLFLWLTGCNIEDLWGRIIYPLFYILGGAVAAGGHVLIFSESSVPLIGASGAISAVMGAFLIRKYNTRVKFFYYFFPIRPLFGTFLVAAWVMGPLWLMKEIGYGILSDYLGGTGVAHWAHVGGFLFGMAAALVMKISGVEEKYLAPAIDAKAGVFKQHPKVVSGAEKLEKGKLDAALMDFKAALRDNPQDVDARRQMAEIYRRKNQPDLAQQELKDLLRMYMWKKQEELAAHTYLELKSLNPQWAPETKDVFPLAQNLEKQGYFNEALYEYYRLYQADPNGPMAVRALLRCGYLLLDNLGQTEHACQAFETAGALAGNDPLYGPQIQAGLSKAQQKLIQPAAAVIEVSGAAPVGVSSSAYGEAQDNMFYQGHPADTDLGATMMEEAVTRARQIQVHRVKVTALLTQGITMLAKDGRQGVFGWDKIKGIFVGKVTPPPPQKGVYLFMDIIFDKAESPQLLQVRTLRINGAELPYRELLENSQLQGIANFKKFTEKLLQFCPEAIALPAPQNLVGNPFREYDSVDAYESDLGVWVERRM